MTNTDIILSIQKWATNGDLIADCARLGYLRSEWRTLDCTYGHGTFWTVWQPDHLTGCDIDPAKSPIGAPCDFTALPFRDREFPCVVFDPPYKLNGTPDPAEERYGVHKPTRWQDRMELIRLGVIECARVPQPDGRGQKHCQQASSQLLVFRRGVWSSHQPVEPSPSLDTAGAL